VAIVGHDDSREEGEEEEGEVEEKAQSPPLTPGTSAGPTGAKDPPIPPVPGAAPPREAPHVSDDGRGRGSEEGGGDGGALEEDGPLAKRQRV
jgi:hypothetical protein